MSNNHKKKRHSYSLTLAIAISSLLPGCALLERDFNAWTGHSVDELVESWGAPASVERMGGDTDAYTWQEAGTSCRRSFMVLKRTVVGYTDTGCSS